jgi:nitrile hydratase accessory protein
MAPVQQAGSSADELEGIVAPPMANGEVIFEAPWQGRVFGMARALCHAGHYSWDEFRDCLIEAIGAFDRESDRESELEKDGSDYRYYEHFLVALETLLVRKHLVDPGELSDRFSTYMARPHNHDH